MYPIYLVLILHGCTAILKETKSNELAGDREKLEFSDSDKSYQYVDPSALLPLTPVISQRILTESHHKKYDDENGPAQIIYLPPPPPLGAEPPPPPPLLSQFPSHLPAISKNFEIHTIVDANPQLAAFLLTSILGIDAKSPGFNHPQHLPTNPYIALLLSHYGRYIPLYGTGRGIYGYSAANNYHNNKPFGAYKIYEDRDI